MEKMDEAPFESTLSPSKDSIHSSIVENSTSSRLKTMGAPRRTSNSLMNQVGESDANLTAMSGSTRLRDESTIVYNEPVAPQPKHPAKKEFTV